MIKKYIFTFTILVLGFIYSNSYAQDFFYEIENGDPGQDTTEIAKIINKEWIQQQNSIMYKLREAFKLTGSDYNKSEQKAFDYIKKIINIALGLVSFVSLILIIYGFYLMFFSQQEEWFTKAKKIFKWVLIAIAIMWLSYFIVAMLFFIYDVGRGQAELPNNTATNSTTNTTMQ